jgi:hypothetical protein
VVTLRRWAACSLVLVLAAVVLATWEARHHDANPSASLCTQALHRKVGSQSMTTVGVIRRYGLGLPPALNQGGTSVAGDYPAHDAFGSSSDSATAAWCWVKEGPWWEAYGVGPDGSSVLFAKMSGSGDTAPVGPPQFK